ncbi:MAG: NADH-quinone oxidoreductase subunit C, partial [Spirochaetes bacterium]|nr:NADH-quinone oxidoreductase subunit C [Spirochaetota bacterium]
KTGSMINIRVLLDNKKPKVESLVPIFAGAEWVEREMHEMLGIDFKNHPNLVPFLLPEDWPKGKYPLRKDHKK